jgi:hypothetical protein
MSELKQRDASNRRVRDVGQQACDRGHELVGFPGMTVGQCADRASRRKPYAQEVGLRLDFEEAGEALVDALLELDRGKEGTPQRV